ncbi:MAG: crotonase/enoyl-CoA hydratase family protein [Myxococcota bacterium]
MSQPDPNRPRVTYEARGHVRLIGLDRAEKRNAFDLRMLRELAEAFTRYEEDAEARCALLFAHGDHFTGGLDLAEVGPAVAQGAPLFPAGSVDPMGLGARVRTKPTVMAVQGIALTIGIELALAQDVRVASEDVSFGQIEVNRGIFPFGGATLRLPQVAGWGGAMRWLLTGERFGAAEAHRIGLVQEVVPVGEAFDRALALAEVIASRAPLGIRATLSSARAAVERGHAAGHAEMMARLPPVLHSEDAREGVQAFLERREGRFQGR